MTPCEAECRQLAAACFSAAWLGNGGGGAVKERWATVGGEEEIRKDFLYFDLFATLGL